MNVEDAIAAFLAHRKPRVRQTTYDTYKFWLSRWLKWRSATSQADELHSVTLAELSAYFDQMLAEGIAPASRDNTWRIVKAMWRLLGRRKLLTAEQLELFGEDGLARIAVPEQIMPVYAEQTILKLLAACDKQTDELQAARNQAIIYLLWETGARASELCSLNDEKTYLELKRGAIVGKGGRPRWLFWDEGAAGALTAYLALRDGPQGGPLLRQAGGEALTYAAIVNVLRRAAKRAGVELLKQSPVHGFRRTFAQDALDEGVADLDLQQLMGHSSIVSTQRYTRRSPDRLGGVYRKMRTSKKRRKNAPNREDTV
jgi:integrase/recombinase XerD